MLGVAGAGLILSPAPILDVIKIAEPFVETNRIIRITFESMKTSGEIFQERENIFQREYKCTAKVAARGSKSGSTIGLKSNGKYNKKLSSVSANMLSDAWTILTILQVSVHLNDVCLRYIF